MEKAYELKALGTMIAMKCKAEGLPIAEEAIERLAVCVYLSLKEWGTQSALISENKLDDFASGFYSYLDSYVLPQIEKLDLDGNGK